MYTYGVGQVVENFKYHSEEVQFDIADDGATMLVFFKIQRQKKLKELYGVIMITVKIGNLNWMDAPYTPHLSKNLTKIPLLSENQGLALTLILVDAIIGKIQHIRLLGLSNRFTEKLFSVVKEHKEKPFDLAEYNQSLNRIFSTYPTSKIIKMSTDYCKIND